ncbi:Colicin V production protein [Arsenophonus endosymbiont of Aleurodicus dispersus]|uniref:CvpA family protein n=1 Tax=Arsenophonus endosymbiont of Aleurodicus dispersus TaxID=235559 RepID=UPI000EACBFB5|nr:CvpA family protein [Arsenophonus endosymbiont of Aleurodicus dispersus]VAY02315.1 Colicin V production protein [Arsenophonus endosymbiont of Aleurodicus dispersus]
MVWIDYAIIAINGFSALISLIRGFIRELLLLITWICVFFFISKFYPFMVTYLTYIDDTLIRNVIAITILFIVTFIAYALVNYIISLLVERIGFYGTDRVLGIFFGVLRGILIVSVILFFLDTFTPLPKMPDWQLSKLIPQFSYIIRWFLNYLINTSSFLSENITPLG